jgi:hypothetical protein
MDKTLSSSSGSFLNQILASEILFLPLFQQVLLHALPPPTPPPRRTPASSSSSSFEVQCTLSQNKILFVNNSTPGRFFKMHHNFLRTGKEKKKKKSEKLH